MIVLHVIEGLMITLLQLKNCMRLTFGQAGVSNVPTLFVVM